MEWQAKHPDQNRLVTKSELREISFDIYGINRERYLELRNVCRSGEYENIVRSAAYAAAPDIAEYILMSVTQNKSYDSLAIEWELGKIERMVCGRTDFYACRRLFYHYLDQMLKKEIDVRMATGTSEI